MSYNIGGTVYGSSADLGYGPPDGYYEVGYNISIVGSNSIQRIRWADYQVVLPW